MALLQYRHDNFASFVPYMNWQESLSQHMTKCVSSALTKQIVLIQKKDLKGYCDCKKPLLFKICIAMAATLDGNCD